MNKLWAVVPKNQTYRKFDGVETEINWTTQTEETPQMFINERK